MWQVTFFDCGDLLAVSSPNYRAIEALYFNLRTANGARLWNVSVKNKPRLIA